MKQKTAIALVSFFSLLLLCVGCGNGDNGETLSSFVSSASPAPVSESVTDSAALSVASSAEASSAPEYYFHSDDPEEKFILVSEPLTLSDGTVLEGGMLLPDGRYFSSEELKKHHYRVDFSYILPDGTVLHGLGAKLLAAIEGQLTEEEWVEAEAENFPEGERWKLLKD